MYTTPLVGYGFDTLILNVRYSNSSFIPMKQELDEELQKELAYLHVSARQDENAVASDWSFNHAFEYYDYVFCTSIGTHIHLTRDMSEVLDELLENAGLPHIRFHDLRHSVATLLMSQGVHPKVVQEFLGHSTITMTMDTYSHVLPSMQQDAIKKMDNILE